MAATLGARGTLRIIGELPHSYGSRLPRLSKPTQRCCQLGSVSNARACPARSRRAARPSCGKRKSALAISGLLAPAVGEPCHLALPLGQARERLGAAGRPVRAARSGRRAPGGAAPPASAALSRRFQRPAQQRSARSSARAARRCRRELLPLSSRVHRPSTDELHPFRCSPGLLQPRGPPTPCSTSPECTRKRPATRLRTNCSCGFGRAGSSIPLGDRRPCFFGMSDARERLRRHQQELAGAPRATTDIGLPLRAPRGASEALSADSAAPPARACHRREILVETDLEMVTWFLAAATRSNRSNSSLNVCLDAARRCT